jgi:hypothetical protein
VVGEDGSGRERVTGAGDEHQLSRQRASPFGLRVLAMRIEDVHDA